jgi:membrane protein DedA with SNARE-associated domain
MLHEWAQAALRAAAEGGPLVFFAIAFATLITEDLTCIAVGLLVAQGTLSLVPATLACYVGILGGDMLLVLIGRTLGRHSLEFAPLRWWVSPKLVARAEYWFERHGPALIFASRFMPGTRVPAYFAAGALRAPLGRFFGWFALACAIWTPLLVGVTVMFGETALHVFASWASVAPALLIAGVAAWLTAKAAVNLSSRHGRRLALRRWRRLTRGKFWRARRDRRDQPARPDATR